MFYVTASVPYSCEPTRGVARCKYITPEPIDIQAVWGSTVKSPTTEIVKPILLIVTAIVALGSIVAHADAIDTEHLFGFTIGTDIGEVGEKEFESNTLSRLGKRAGSYSALSQSLYLGIYGGTESSSRSERHRRLLRHRWRPWTG